MWTASTKLITAELDRQDRLSFVQTCEGAGLRLPSVWQQNELNKALIGTIVPDVMEQFDACAFPRAVNGLDHVVAEKDTVFVAPNKRLPNWRNRFGASQNLLALEDLDAFLADMPRQPPAQSSSDRLCFVVPMVHPHGRKVSDYNTVEAILKQTIRSCLLQTHKNISVIVVCHSRPEWAGELDARVSFVVLNDGPEWTAADLDVREDKGAKHLLGAQLALTKHQARAVMFLDGDDFLHKDFARLALKALPKDGDGLSVSRGYHAALQRVGARFSLKAALQVDEFQHTCGSCRVFAAQVLADRMIRWWPRALTTDMFSDGLELLTDGYAQFQCVLADTKGNEYSTVRILGRHAPRTMLAELTSWSVPLVAKGCGHGNHDGPRKGEVHWNRCVGAADLAQFASDFSLEEAEFDFAADPSLTWRARAVAPFNRLKRLF
ncbi:MAG: hypothetical protein ACU0BK_08355 [Shimia sp.]|uniref:hypothetical protein n=1 Tax=Shimia sp. TaxID=1954381 RepID=UPI00405A19B9